MRRLHPGKRRKPISKGTMIPGGTDGFNTSLMCLIYLRRIINSSMPLNDEHLEALVQVISPDAFRRIADRTVRLWNEAPQKSRINTRYDESDILDRNGWGRTVMQLLAGRALAGGEKALFDMINRETEHIISRETDPIDGFRERLDELVSTFRITEEDLLTLLFLFTLDQHSSFDRIFGEFNTAQIINAVAVSTDLSRGSVRKALSSQGRLARNGLIDENGLGAYSHNRLPDIEDNIREFLSGMTEGGLRERNVKRDSGKRYRPASFRLPDGTIDVLRALLIADGPSQILFYGKPGTGKTELARTITAAAGISAYFFQDDPDSRRVANRSGLVAAAEKVADEKGVLIIDEADKWLNSPDFLSFLMPSLRGGDMAGKEWVNNYLDNNRAKIIWITNRTNSMAPSVRRRFDYSLEFRDFNREQRLAMWKELVREHGFRGRIPASMQNRLAAEYPVNAGTIATVLKAAAASVPADANAEKLEPVLEELLSRQLDLLGISRLRDNVSVGRQYAPEALRLDTDRIALETSLKGFAAYLKTAPRREMRSLNSLFWGPSGTGKTEYARYLAGILGKELIIKRASDLIDPYIGVTEKNIRNAFKDASRQDAILFIDEADSFLRTREKAHRSWEISFVNEFLTNMENFRGILICCTNLLEELDPASLRRFQWKVGFLPLEKEGKELLFRKYFHGGKLKDTVSERLAALDRLVPGDFKAVFNRLSFMPEGSITPELALAELEKEIRVRSSKTESVGFTVH